MDIEYDDSKEVRCFRDFVTAPDDRVAARKFSKIFGAGLMAAAKKLHERLTLFDSAGSYNAIYGRTDNRIEIKLGSKKNEPLILKVRIDRGYRKFFYHLKGGNKDNFAITQNWDGDFKAITSIYIIAINNHDYNKI